MLIFQTITADNVLIDLTLSTSNTLGIPESDSLSTLVIGRAYSSALEPRGKAKPSCKQNHISMSIKKIYCVLTNINIKLHSRLFLSKTCESWGNGA